MREDLRLVVVVVIVERKKKLKARKDWNIGSSIDKNVLMTINYINYIYLVIK